MSVLFKRTPKISVIVIFHNMQREGPRTLFSLSAKYQQDIAPYDWEVIAIDNGSSQPLDAAAVHALGPQFRYVYHETTSVSPAGAVNAGVCLAKGKVISVCIDGARILSPGILSYSLQAFALFPDPFVCSLGWHLGTEVQNISIPKGYGPAQEDELLASADWQANGYALFAISTLALSCREGGGAPISESNFFSLRQDTFMAVGGFDEKFEAPGGGLVNLDFFKSVCERVETKLVILLGEGSFHQVHGGVATNVPMEKHPWKKFHQEYIDLRGVSYEVPTKKPYYLGHIPSEARHFLQFDTRS